MSTAYVPVPEETGFRVRTPAEIAAAGESLRRSITNSMKAGDASKMAEDAGVRREEISREIAPDPYAGARFRVGHLRVSVLLAAVNRDIRRGDASRIEGWKQLLFGGVTEIREERVAIVRFTKDGRQFQLLG